MICDDPAMQANPRILSGFRRHSRLSRSKTVSLTTPRYGAFSAGDWEQTSEGIHEKKGGFQCPFSKN